MKLEFQNRWVRLLIEFLPLLPAIRRYRVISRGREGCTQRSLRRQISRRLLHSEEES